MHIILPTAQKVVLLWLSLYQIAREYRIKNRFFVHKTNVGGKLIICLELFFFTYDTLPSIGSTNRVTSNNSTTLEDINLAIFTENKMIIKSTPTKCLFVGLTEQGSALHPFGPTY